MDYGQCQDTGYKRTNVSHSKLKISNDCFTLNKRTIAAQKQFTAAPSADGPRTAKPSTTRPQGVTSPKVQGWSQRRPARQLPRAFGWQWVGIHYRTKEIVKVYNSALKTLGMCSGAAEEMERSQAAAAIRANQAINSGVASVAYFPYIYIAIS